MSVGPRPRVGALAIIGGDRSHRARALSAFDAADAPAQVFEQADLTLAWNAQTGSEVHVSERTVCVLAGTLFELDSLRAPSGADAPPAAVLAGAYGRLGNAVFEQLRGEFWCLLWDRRARRGALACDQLGTRSPYWARSGRALVCAGEVRDLLTVLPSRPAPDPAALAHWLTLSAPRRGATLYGGVRRLEAAHVLVLGEGTAEPRRYWMPVYRRPLRIAKHDAVAALRERLERSVARRLAPGASGVLLSGGLDSSTVAAIAAQVEPQAPPRAYSATFPNHPGVDESALIERTVDRLGLASTRIAVSGGSILAGAAAYMDAWELPPTSPNLFFWIPLLKRAAADGVRVMLDGEGGDELFGLSPFLIADRIRQGRLLSALQLPRRVPPSARPHSLSRDWLLMRRFGMRGAIPPAAHRLRRRLRRADPAVPTWMPPRLASAWLTEQESPFAWKLLAGPRWWAFLADFVTRDAGPAMVYEQSRRRAAQAGLQSVHPLVDVDVVELVLRLPPELAFDARLSRPLLRESTAGLLPDEVRTRSAKSNFDQVFHASLAGPDLAITRELLGAADAELRAFIDLDWLLPRLLAGDPPTNQTARRDWANQVWRLVTAECWLRGQHEPSAWARLAECPDLAALDHEFGPG